MQEKIKENTDEFTEGDTRKFGTRAGLHRAIERYLGSISRRICVTEEYPTGELDAKGKPIKAERPMLNDRGCELYTRQWISPPSESGLCLALGISRREWESYGRDSELGCEVERMRTVIRAYLESEISTRQKNLTGLIWQLRQASGEEDIDIPEVMSIDEKCEILRSLGVSGDGI